MRLLLFIILALVPIDLTRLSKINSVKSEARKAFEAADYKRAAERYQYLVDSMQVREDEVLLNLAHAYFQLNDTAQAAQRYQQMLQTRSSQLKSVAFQQLGVLTNRQGKAEEALQQLKQALLADPGNDDARYNYELIRRKLDNDKKKEEEKKDKQQDKKDDQKKDNKDQKKDQQNKQQEKDKKDQQKKDQQDKQDQQSKDEQKKKEEQQKKDQEKQQKEQQEQQQKDDAKKDKKEIPPSVSEKLKDMQMSEEKAKMILEAMKNQETQYWQQNKRKATRPKSSNKPDW